MPGIIVAEGARELSFGRAVFLVSPAVMDDELELLRVPAGSVGFFRYAVWARVSIGHEIYILQTYPLETFLSAGNSVSSATLRRRLKTSTCDTELSVSSYHPGLRFQCCLHSVLLLHDHSTILVQELQPVFQTDRSH